MVIPTILEKDFQQVKNKVTLLEKRATLIQIDIADGKIVEGETFLDKESLTTLETISTIELDLMVENPQEWIEIQNNKIVKACANILAKTNIPAFITTAKNKNIKVGISINPDTTLNEYEEFVPQVDFVQFMGVIPGAQGRTFENSVIAQIIEFKNKYPQMEIQVDGHINKETLPILKEIGVSHFVVGSDIFNSSNPIKEYEELSLMAQN